MKFNKFFTLVSLILFFISMSGIAQEEHIAHDEEHFQHHRIALFTGYGLIPAAVDVEGNNKM